MENNTIPLKNSIIATYHNGKELCSVCINLEEEDAIGVFFEKGYVVVRTQNETKFVCKGKAFVSLWKN